MHLDKLAVIGVGLIGTSCALALRAAGAVSHVVGVGRSQHNLDRARDRGAIDRGLLLGDAWKQQVADADLVLIAIPVAQYRGVLGELADVLHDLHLTIPPGTTVALVGHTGAGKSTIAKLLARFYDPRAGRITVDGVDLRDVTQSSLRGQLGIVPHEGFLFGGTIAENVAFGRPSASHEEIESAVRAVGGAAGVWWP